MLCLITTVIGQNWRMMSNTSEWVKKGQLAAANLLPVSAEADSFMQTLGYPGASDFMLNIAGQETLYGQIEPGMHSMGVTQIDPIRYNDMLKDIGDMQTKYPEATEGYGAHAKEINKYMKSKGDYYKDFDITKMAEIGQDEAGNMVYTSKSKYSKDPLANFMLTRLLLSKDKKNPIPKGTTAQSGYWKSFWNTLDGKGKITDFAEKINTYRPESVNPVKETMDDYHKNKKAFTR